MFVVIYFRLLLLLLFGGGGDDAAAVFILLIMRNQELKRRRNIAVCKRFAYLADTLLIRFDIAVKQMSENESPIHNYQKLETTIYDILRENRGKELPDLNLSLELDNKRFEPITMFEPPKCKQVND